MLSHHFSLFDESAIVAVHSLLNILLVIVVGGCDWSSCPYLLILSSSVALLSTSTAV